MNETKGEVAGNEYIKEELIIKFYTTNEDGKDIRYAIGGVNNGIFNVVYENTFIDKDGKLVGSITGNLIEFLKGKPTMLGVYSKYLEQKNPSLSKFSKMFKSTPKVHPERTAGGKKTKSNRSYNANKTLKNRK